MPFEPEKITQEDIFEAAKLIDSGAYEIKDSTGYDVVINGKHYPPKEIMRFAHEKATGEYLWYPSGGEPTNKYLKALGFEIIEKTNMNPWLAIIEDYKKKIAKNGNEQEIYKWKLIKNNDNKFDTHAINFYEDIRTIKFQNLVYHNGIVALNHIAKEYPEEVRVCFKDLFNESRPLGERIEDFTNTTLTIYRRLEPTLSHHQDERTIATYLTFKYPTVYTFYKNSFYKTLCHRLGIATKSKGQKYLHYLSLVEEFVKEYIEEDEELLAIKKSFLTPDCFSDDNNLILAQDILYQALDNPHAETKKYWRMGTRDDQASYWYDMLDGNYIAIGWPKIGDLSSQDIIEKNHIAYLLNEVGYPYSTSSMRSRKAGEIFNFYDTQEIGDIVLAQDGDKVLAIGEVTGDYEFKDDLEFPHTRAVKWLKTNITNFYSSDGRNTTVYEISKTETIAKINNLLNLPEATSITTHQNVMAKNLNTILFGPPGTGKTFKLQNEYFEKFTTRSSLTKEQYFINTIGQYSWWQVIAAALMDLKIGKVIDIEKHELIKFKSAVSNTSTVKQTIWGQLQSHTIMECDLVKVTKKMSPLIFNKKEDSMWEIVGDTTDEAPEVLTLFNDYKNFTPGSDKEIRRYKFLTFHQSYSYEDFIEGIKPALSNDDQAQDLSYHIESGIFKEMCDIASQDLDNDYAIFIDEINRGNVSNIFGELITLIEDDKRIGAKHQMHATLPYSKKTFGVPNNLYIIGTMNTADRSVEALDAALRRRFSFVEMMPDYALVGSVGEIDLAKVLETINKRLCYLINEDHQIGHSYFMGITDKEELIPVFKNKIIPLLKEYFYNDTSKIQLVLGEGFVKKEIRARPKFAIKGNDVMDKEVYTFVHFDEQFNITEAVRAIGEE